jgi:FAD/FMN-containing dehydrogenase
MINFDSPLGSELATLLPRERVLTRPIERIAYASDASFYRLIPQAVVQPVSVNEVVSLFDFGRRRGIPLTFRAAGTSLSCQAVTDGILVDISKHWGRIHSRIRHSDEPTICRVSKGRGGHSYEGYYTIAPVSV